MWGLMNVRRSILIFALAITFLALGVAAVTLFFTRGPESDKTQSSTVPIGGHFALQDTSGKTVTDQTYRGKWLLIYFGYTYCPDACPTALNNMSVALKKLGPDASRLQPLFITVDPKRDTAQVMADYLKSFDPRIVGLTGSQAQTDSVVKAYRVYVAPQNTGGSDYLVDHTAAFYLMDPEGRFLNVISSGASGDEIAARLRKEFIG
jgi:protein SCO1/2